MMQKANLIEKLEKQVEQRTISKQTTRNAI